MIEERADRIRFVDIKKLKGTKPAEPKKELKLLDGSSDKIDYRGAK